jgi:hypothetical protein
MCKQFYNVAIIFTVLGICDDLWLVVHIYIHHIYWYTIYGRVSMYIISILRFALRDKVAHRLLKLWSRALRDWCWSVSMTWTHTVNTQQHQLEYNFRIKIKLYLYSLATVISWFILRKLGLWCLTQQLWWFMIVIIIIVIFCPNIIAFYSVK